MNLSINNFITATKNGKLPEYNPAVSNTKSNNNYPKKQAKDSIEILSKNNEKSNRKKKNKLIAFTGFGLSAAVATVAFLHHKNKISKVVRLLKISVLKKLKLSKKLKILALKLLESRNTKDLMIRIWIF